MLLINCIIIDKPNDSFYLEFSDCPRLNDTLVVDGIEYDGLKVSRHTKKNVSRKLSQPVYNVLHTNLLLAKRN